MRLHLPTQHPPNSIIKLGFLNIERAPSKVDVVVSRWMSLPLESVYIDSVDQDIDVNMVTDWIAFHSFVFCDEHLFLDVYERSTPLSESLQESDISRGVNYNDIALSIDPHCVSEVPISYYELFARYQALSLDEKVLIREWLTLAYDRESYTPPPEKRIRNSDLFYIARYFALVEKVFKKKKDEKDIFKKRIDPGIRFLIQDQKRADGYLVLLKEVQKIRHDIAHGDCYLSHAQMRYYPKTSRHYLLNESLAALRSPAADQFQIHQVQDAMKRFTKLLLLAKLFNIVSFPPFENLSEMNATCIGSDAV